MSRATLVEALLDALPQTQCTRCGYPDCRGYAEAIALDGVDINRCPPGGLEGVKRLARLTGRPPSPIDPACGKEGPRARALVDEAWCIGCALCLKACPVDAIVGAAKRMHTVIDDLCTGCELCIPVCPVDCISLVGVTGTRSGWNAWSAAQADEARARYALHVEHLGTTASVDDSDGLDTETAAKTATPSKGATIAAALAAARARSTRDN